MVIINRLLNSRWNFIRRAYRRLFAFMALRFDLFRIPCDVQSKKYAEIGLMRPEGVNYIDPITEAVFGNAYSEENGMFSEHLILFSSIAVSEQSINSILEIGTYDGRTALLFSKLFPSAKIRTIDLPAEDEDFINSYARRNSAAEFRAARDEKLSQSDDISFYPMNSIKLSEWTENYDLIWVDGAHGYPVVAMDIINAVRLCAPGGYVMIDDIWTSAGTEEKMYRSIGGLECLNELKKAGLIESFTLVHKRLGTRYNVPWKQKYVAIFKKPHTSET